MRTKLRLAVLLLAGLVCLQVPTGSAPAGTFPQPSKYPVAWQLAFTHGTPKRIAVAVPGKGTVAYWYLTFNVTNNGNDPQQFLPVFDLVTTTGSIVHSDFAIPAEVFLAIKNAEGNSLLQRLPTISGPVLPGVDAAKDGVAIWPEPTPRMGNFQIFVGGLSGEAVQMKDSDGKPQNNPDGSPMLLHKTFEIDFSIYGDELYPDKDEVHAKGESWVMR